VPPDQAKTPWRPRVAAAALILVISLAVADAALAPAPAPEQPDFIDTILASWAVVVALRIAVVFAALFVALSVVALIAQRRWLTRLGPVEVSGRVSELEAENQRHEEDLEAAHRVIDALEDMAASTHQLVDKEREI
jgi:hypothetical protein